MTDWSNVKCKLLTMLEDTNQQATIGTLIPPGRWNFPVRDRRRDVNLTENAHTQTLTWGRRYSKLTQNVYNQTIDWVGGGITV